MTDQLFSVAGKTALVTGGTGGIGRMIAEGLCRRGARTWISGRDADRTATAAAEIAAATGGACFAVAGDLESEDGPAALAAAFAAQEQRLHLLVNNAGAGEVSPIDDTTVAAWDRVMDTNLRGLFFLTQGLLPLIRAAATPADPGRIINIGSIGGLHIPNWESFPYGASKAAVHHLTRALTKRLGRDHITVNAIAPGPFPSKMNNVESEAVKKSIATYIPLNRAGTPEDAEGLVVFLASRAGAYVNGSTIPLDGGYIAAL
ncbi:SDR family oxidoreductase [Sphingomonas canadensis]|uniref:SDR family oxidoreductase n=1 Tax=Sphingomonas canadensis TaxID=1219257 RepID=A0ABW3HEQ8_9SPHN|nr:SDR family oxidoreductase [Sphingomonas canadensis]MCW3837694.1 SDR family oxidoreductase [Sphingomonas canadensis]